MRLPSIRLHCAMCLPSICLHFSCALRADAFTSYAHAEHTFTICTRMHGACLEIVNVCLAYSGLKNDGAPVQKNPRKKIITSKVIGHIWMHCFLIGSYYIDTFLRHDKTSVISLNITRRQQGEIREFLGVKFFWKNLDNFKIRNTFNVFIEKCTLFSGELSPNKKKSAKSSWIKKRFCHLLLE